MSALGNARAVAAATAREVLGSTLPWAALGITALLMLLSTALPSFTLEEQGDLKFMMDVSLSGVALALLAVGLWPAATGVSDEFARRTAMTLLSKPLSRASYLLGRQAGILCALAVSWALLAAAFLGCVWLTESRALNAPLEAWMDEVTYGIPPGEAAPAPRTPLRWSLLPVCSLALGPAVLLTSVATALSTAWGPLPVLGASGLVYVLGHLSAALDPSALPGLLARTALPQLAFFSPSEAVACGVDVPAGHALGCLAYAVAYGAAAILAALPAFERRELA